ncbi:nitroreductase family protein [Streptomyces sp. ISL-43]|uniref:nitroreductase family protein n=1 Tax=Streptomyces sp. ISL-43 TaxID=2819183 RepID=UPI001BEACE92|nr:nitroreductase family protein [Streptomyces sp. ISL-43]MBT2445597.1 nitroreductase family protein [Streptomyces sp. ISL-43]
MTPRPATWQRPEPLSGPLDYNDVMRELQVRSRLDQAAVRRYNDAPDPALATPSLEADAPGVPVTPAAAGARPLDELLRDRVAVRTYAPAPVTADELAAVLNQAQSFDSLSWPDHHAGGPLGFLVAARNVTGLPTGLYGYEPELGEFSRLADLPEGEAAESMVLQMEFAWAPAIVLVCGSLAASLDRHGEHGHRLLMARAGAAAHTAWLAALDQGLVGSIFAGFLSSALKPLLGLDGYRTAQLLAFAVGRPPLDGPAA